MATQQAITNKINQNLYGNSGVGTPQVKATAEQILSSGDANSIAGERARTESIIAERKAKGMDTGVQQNWLNRVLQSQNSLQTRNPAPSTQYGSNDDPVLDDIRSFVKQSGESSFQGQKAMLDANLENQIADLEKAYADAIAEGKISIRDAEDQFNKQVQSINQGAYLDAQRTGMMMGELGIQHSNQGLALVDDANQRTANLRNSNISERDKRVNDLKDRINAITAKKDLDIANSYRQYDAGLLQARSQADQLINDKMFQMDFSNYEAQRNQNFQRENMALENQYARDNLGLQNQYAMGQARVQQGYQQENMAQEQQNQLAILAQQFKNASILQDDAQAHDVSMQKAQFAQQMSMAAQSARNSQALARINKAGSSAMSDIQKEELAYQKSMDRALQKYGNPNSKEYKLYEAEMKANLNKEIAGITAKAQAEAKINATVQLSQQKPAEPSFWRKITGQGLTAEQKAQNDAIKRAQQSLIGN